VSSTVLVRVRLARRRVARRRAGVSAALGALAFALFTLTLMIGSTWVSPGDVLASLLSLREDPLTDFVVRELRLPTAATALMVGMAFGVAGPLFQRMLGNPLASPDFVGVSTGASLFAAGAIVLLHLGGLWVSGAALLGASVSSLLIYLLAFRGGITGFRFILMGIGVSAFMSSLVGYLLARSQIFDARAAMAWLTGSVGFAGATELRVLTAVLVLTLPLVLVLDSPVRVLELGDEPAAALGLRVEHVRRLLIGVGVLLVGVATAAAGPIPFVALMAGPIASRLLGPARGGVLAAGFVGASIVLGADLVSNHLLPSPLPTGVVTGLVGAPYLVWLLATANADT
jgi:iron-siderophore transport system permease protein